jgi:hypothetical protein
MTNRFWAWWHALTHTHRMGEYPTLNWFICWDCQWETGHRPAGPEVEAAVRILREATG